MPAKLSISRPAFDIVLEVIEPEFQFDCASSSVVLYIVGGAAVPFRFEIPLTALEPGRYDCQVSIMDGNDGKASFWREPVQVVP